MDSDNSAKTALTLSGGGFRGLLFHLGGMWRLNEFGLLPRIDTYSGISGGSIIASLLGLRWRKLRFSEAGVAGNFSDEIAGPVREFCSRTHDLAPTILNGLLNHFGWSNRLLARAYRRHLFGESTLADLPESGPRIIINACSLQSGAPVTFTRDELLEPSVGRLPFPKTAVADAVAASSAFPPFLSPVVIDLPADRWEFYADAEPVTVHRDKIRLVLSDGALSDPLGLDAVWNDHHVLLVSDATTMQAAWRNPSSNWFRQLNRAVLIQCDASSIRRRTDFLRELSDGDAESHRGAYWCNAGSISSYGLADPLADDSEITRSLGTMRTRLDRFTPAEQGQLINWGYAMCDAALRKSGYEQVTDATWPSTEQGLK